MAQLTRHSGHLPILSNNHVLLSSHHWFYPYPSTVYSIPAECFSSHVSRLLGRTKGQCIVIFVQIYRGVIKFSIYRGSPISSQIARHFFTLELTKLERGHKRPATKDRLKPWIIQSVTLPLSAATHDSALPRFCIQFLVTYSCILPRLGFKRCLPFDCICRTDFSVHQPYAMLWLENDVVSSHIN